MKKVYALLLVLMAFLSACQKPDVTIGKVESITFDSETYTLQENEDITLSYRLTILPEIVGDTVTVSWSVADTTVAKVSANGSVEAVREGETYVTASAMGVKATCQIVVEPIKIKDFSIPSELTVYVNEPTEIEISDLSPHKAPLYRITWDSSDDEVMPKLVNDKKWVLTTDKVGTYTLTATSGKLEARTCNVTVKIRPITKFELSKTSLALVVGEEATLDFTLEPENASYTKYEWSSTNTNVVTVDEKGKVTAVGAGEASILVTHYPVNESDTMKEAECEVTVTKTPPVTEFSVENTYVKIVRKETAFVQIKSVLPEGASASTLKWEIEDPTIAQIAGGTSDGIKKQINGLKIGETTLKISSSTGFSKLVTIEVEPIDPTAVVWNFEDICVWEDSKISVQKPTLIPADADYEVAYFQVKGINNPITLNDQNYTLNVANYDDDEFTIQVVVQLKGRKSFVTSSTKNISVIPFYYTSTKGFEEPITDVYGTFGESFDYKNFNYDKYKVKPTIKGYVDQQITTTGKYAAAELSRDKRLVYYLQTPKTNYDNRIKQTKEYVSALSYSVRVTDGLGVTKDVQAPQINLHASFLGLAFNYYDDNSFNPNWNGNGADNVEMWLDDHAKKPGDIVKVSGKPTIANAQSMYVKNKYGHVTGLTTEPSKDWPANSYAPCYVGKEAANALGVEPLQITFAK